MASLSQGTMGKYVRSLFYFSALLQSSALLGATYTVNSTADTNTGSLTTGTLRYCINQANNAAGPNTIQFGTSGTIILTQSLPPIGSNITIVDAMANAITINGTNGGNSYQAFFCAPNSTGLTFKNTGGGSIAVQNAASIGGNGGTSAGGGALGAGGGLFVGENSTVTIQGMSFSGCHAKGGNGGSDYVLGGGGGGGMSQGTGGIGGANNGSGGGGGGGYGGIGGNGGGDGGGAGGGGGGLFLSGGSGADGFGDNVGGGGGGSDLTAGASASGNFGGNGGNSIAGNVGGTGGAGGGTGGNGAPGTGNSGGGGGGGSFSGNAGNGGDSQMGAGGGGNSFDPGSGPGGNGGNSTGSFGGGGGGGSSSNTFPGSGGNGGAFGGGGGGSAGGPAFNNTISPGGNGGFGGGGGGINALFGALNNPNVGNGGFGGGGGGGGYLNATSGLGGYGASNGSKLFGGGGGAALGGTIFVSKGATLHIADFPAGSISSNPSTAGSGGNGAAFAAGPDIFLMSGGTISFEQATTFTINTPIASDGGAGGGSGGGIIMNNATGSLILGGSNTYTGSTTCSAGTIKISQDANLGANGNGLTIQNGGSFEFTGSTTLNSSRVVTLGAGGASLIVDSGVNGSIAGTVTGSGLLTKTGAGILGLQYASNNYSGGTQINQGTVQISNAPQQSNPTTLGTGPVTLNGGNLEVLSNYGNNQSVPNALTVSASSQILSDLPAGQNLTFSGAAVLNAGTLSIGQSAASNTILSGAISGGGNLKTTGPGQVVIKGAAAYTGTTTVQSGTLAVTSPGSITSSSSIQVNSGGILTVSGSVASPIQVNSGGLLTVNGSVTSPVQINSGGTLNGLGPLGNTVTINGIIAPGNSINTLTGTDFIFNTGSTYQIEISNSTTDLISASGTVTINGGQLLLIPRNFSAPSVSSYTIITAGSVIENVPFTFANPLTRFPMSVVYTGTSVSLVINSGPFPFNTIVTKGNAGKVAECFEVLYLQNHPDLAEIVTILELQTVGQMTKSFNEMQPVNANNIAFTEENVAERVRQLFTEHFFEKAVNNCYREKDWDIWASPFLENVRQHGNDSLPGYQDRFTGFTAALDYYLKDHWMFTGGFSFASTEMKVPDGRTRADYDTYAGSLGALWTNTSFFADAVFSYLYSPIHAKRKMYFSINHFAHSDTVNRTATYDQSSNQLLGHIGGGYNFKFREGRTNSFNLYPFANLDYQYLMQGGYSESGAHSLDLKVRNKEYDLLRPEAGLGMGYKGCFEKRHIFIDLSFSYIHEFRFMGQDTTAKFKPADCTFRVKGLKPENNLFSPSLKIRSTSPLNGFSFMLGYHGEYGRHFILNAGEAEIARAF